MRPKRIAWVAAGVVVVVAAVVAVLVVRDDNGGTDATEPSGPGAGPALAVKIDNVAEARPATGLGSADLIYVEPVEGGLTRLFAVFSSRRPAAVGPVRSARETDYDLLAQFGHPVFAYSGAVPQVVDALHAPPLSARIVNASPTDASAAYYRDDGRAAPHNLFIRTEKLPTSNGTTPTTVLARGAAPSGGTPVTDRRVDFPAAGYDFRWTEGHWLIWADGKPFTSTESGQLAADTVVVQQVRMHLAPYPEDPTGAHAPVAETVGTGKATVLRDGQSFDATWSRAGASEGTTFTTASGAPLALATGPVWILLTS